MKQKQNLYLLLEQAQARPGYSGPSYFHVFARPVCREGDSPRNMIDDAHDGLTVSCQGDVPAKRDQPYGWDVEYRDVVAHLDSRRLSRMLNVLRRVEKSLAQQVRVYGQPSTYADYVLRVGNALGVAGYVVKSGGNSTTYSENTWRWMTAADAQHQIATWVYGWAKSSLKEDGE